MSGSSLQEDAGSGVEERFDALDACLEVLCHSHVVIVPREKPLGIARRTFYRWYDRCLDGGPEALEDRASVPSRLWNRIAPEVQDQIAEMALGQSELLPCELAVRFTDERRCFVSEATVDRLLNAHDLITSPAYVVIKVADALHTNATRPNEMWQTDFTYFQDHRVGLDVPVDRARRRLALHHRLEAVHQHPRRRRARQAGPRARGIRLRSRHRAAQAQSAQ